jgi:hypothetical protein
MRKVLYKKWIPVEYIQSAGLSRRQIIGTGCWEHDFINEGIFHQWGNAYEEFESGAGNFTVALIENADGTMSEVLPSNLKFIEP